MMKWLERGGVRREDQVGRGRGKEMRLSGDGKRGEGNGWGAERGSAGARGEGRGLGVERGRKRIRKGLIKNA